MVIVSSEELILHLFIQIIKSAFNENQKVYNKLPIVHE